LEPDDPALVGVWLFDEGEGEMINELFNENHATVMGDFSWDNGRFGNAIVASGGGSIDVADSDSLASIANGLTVAAWFRVDADSDTGVRKNGAFLLEDQSGSEPVPDAFATCFWTDAGVNCFFGQTVLEQGVWNHVAATYDGESVELYVNGKPESEIGFVAGSGDDIDPELSGEVLPGEGNPLQLKYGPETYIGGIDEVVILNRALEPGEINQLIGGWASVVAASVGSPGDFNGDEVVDLADFEILLGNFNTSVDSLEAGDMDFNRRVDLTDFVLFRKAFGEANAAAAVPEPGVGALLGGVVMLVPAFRRRSYRKDGGNCPNK
jgi:hypothetical protein